MKNITDIHNIHSFYDLLDYSALNGGDDTAFSFKKNKTDVERKSFISFRLDILKLARSFLNIGLGKTKIAIIGENSISWIEAFFAINMAGSVIVPLDKDLVADELTELINRSKCTAIIYSKSYENKIEAIKQRKTDLTYICFSDICRLIDDIDNVSEYEFSPVDENDTALIVFTSGTTGGSKGVMLSQKNLLSNAVSAFDMLYESLKNCTCVTVVLPFHHTFGLLTGVIVPMMKLGNAFICGSLRRIVSDIKLMQPDILFLVPVIAETILKKIWLEAAKQEKDEKLRKGIKFSNALRHFGIDIRSKIFSDVHANFGGKLKTIICGGAPLSTDCIKGFDDIGIEVMNGYGITECSPIVSVNGVGRKNRPGSAGIPLSCNKVRITSPDVDGIGDIEVCGSNVMKGYLDDSQATSDAFDGEWFLTGDCGKIDKNGFLYLTGRKKNLIILSNGKNVSPEELEEKLCYNNLIEEVVVCEKDGKITAQIYPNQELYSGNEKDIFDIVDKINRTVPPYKNIEKIIVRSSPFEKTTTMKIKRNIGEKND